MRARDPVSGGSGAGRDPGSPPESDPPEGVSSIGQAFAAAGELRAAEHVIIEGSFDGRVFIPDHELAVGRRGRLTGEALARRITVLGRASGRLVADRIEIASGAAVEAELVAERLVVADGAFFRGAVDPSPTDAAFAVFEHERGKRPPERTETMRGRSTPAGS